jgi:ABC-type Fe3+ transport system permease subunit
MVGAGIGVHEGFEAVARGTPVADAARASLWYGGLAGLVAMLIGLVAALLYRPWRPR